MESPHPHVESLIATHETDNNKKPYKHKGIGTMDTPNTSNSNPNLDPNPDVPEDNMDNMLEDMVDNVNNSLNNPSDTNKVGNPTPTDFNAYLTLVGEVLRNETSDPWERLEPTPEEREMFDTHDEFVAELWEEIGKERGYGRTVEEGAVGKDQ
jgi:hypothetical protein